MARCNLVQLLVSVSILLYTLFLFTGVYQNEIEISPPPPLSDEEVQRLQRKVWIAMGLCWDEHPTLYGKQDYPYAEAALRSISLWHKLTAGRVILQIMYNGQVDDNLRNYRNKLEDMGAVVYLNKTGNLSCVLSSQLSRMVTFSLDLVQEDDIIITSDVDAFIMTKDFLQPLKEDEKVWIWQYQRAVDESITFAMSFIGATSQVWRELLNYRGTLESLVEDYNRLINFKDSADVQWSIDQLIITHVILKSGLCSLSSRRWKVWKEVNLNSTKARDSESCWKGGRMFDDCNKQNSRGNRRGRYSCSWWHFFPEERTKQMDQKYRDILRLNGL